MRLASLVAVLLLSACARGGPAGPPLAGPVAPARPSPSTADEREAVWRLHLLDVGTGLALLLEGEDFALLYDGGSNDDRAVGPKNRLTAYLQTLRGPSGPGARCRPDAEGDLPERPLTHVFLSHPHQDHVLLLPDVLACFAVAHVWDSGASASTRAYDNFLAAVAAEPGVTYHTARPPSPTGRIRARDEEHAIATWKQLREGDRLPLGRRAEATILSARWDVRDPNDASIVMRVDLGAASVLFTGDATGGERQAPSQPPAETSVEAELLAEHRAELDVDVLQVAHHGSRTSSRRAFLEAVTPKWALLGSGPMRYGEVVLPDEDVIAELERLGARVLRTDVDDAACGAQNDKIGPRADDRPGGCTAYTLRIDSRGPIALEAGPWAAPPPGPPAPPPSAHSGLDDTAGFE